MDSEQLMTLGVDIVESAAQKDVCIRLLGGVAVAVLCADSFLVVPTLRRALNDIDFAGYSHQSGAIEQILAHRGLTAAKEFNFLNAGRRLLYYRPHDNVKIDVFLDEFRMCHRLAFAGRLELAPRTLSLTDLLLTKLQVVKLTKKDLMDIYAILLHANPDLRGNSEGWIDRAYVVELCSRDWGWFRTVIGTLARSSECNLVVDKSSSQRVSNTLQDLTRAIHDSRKTILWSLRALVGDRCRWFECPEEFSITPPR
jgi:hypothetical protein